MENRFAKVLLIIALICVFVLMFPTVLGFAGAIISEVFRIPYETTAHLISYAAFLIPAVIWAVIHTRSRRRAQAVCEISHGELKKLLRQVHTGESVRTDPPIAVSVEMREKLAYPLGAGVTSVIGGTEYPVSRCEFNYSILSSEWRRRVLYVTAQIDIDYCDTAAGIDEHHHGVTMHIALVPNRNYSGLKVVGVEYGDGK